MRIACVYNYVIDAYMQMIRGTHFPKDPYTAH